MTADAPRTEFFTPGKFAGLLALLLLGMYYRVILGGESFYYRDFGVLAIPTTTYHKASLLSGEIPFWNPLSNCGAPFLAQWGTMVLYPLSLIYVLLPMPWSLNFFCVAHLWLGGMGMFFLVRRWCGESWPAVIAGVAFTFNGITQAALAWPNYVAALALFPWVLLTVESAWNAKSAGKKTSPVGAVFGAALVSAAQLLAGVPELSVLTWILVTALWIVRLKERPEGIVFRHLAVLGATAGFVAIQLFPFYELLQYSHRAPGFAAEKWPLPPWGWANFILPRFRTFVTPEGTAFQYNQAFLSSTYLGAPLLALACASFLKRDRRFWVLTTTSVLAAILALGSAGILYPVLTKIFPPLSIARYPAKFLFLLAFTVPLLAAFGAQALLRLPVARRKGVLLLSGAIAILVSGALIAVNQSSPLQYDRLAEFRTNSSVRMSLALAMLGAIYFAMAICPKRLAAQLAFLLLFIIDAKTHLQKLNPTVAASTFQGEIWTQGHQLPKPVHGQGRIFITPEAEAKLLHSVITDPQQGLTGLRLAEWSHLNLLDRVPKVNGSSTLQVREQAEVQTSLYSGTNQNLEAWLDFLNVRLRTSSESVVRWEERTNAMPLVTAGQRVVFGEFDPLATTNDFRNQVVLQKQMTANPDARNATSAVITNLSVAPHEIRFEVNAAAPTVVTLSQSWYSCWRISIEHTSGSSIDQPLLRANLAFQAALIPAGQSAVRIYYNDHGFKMGAAVTGATFLIFALVWVREKKNALLKNEKSIR